MSLLPTTAETSFHKLPTAPANCSQNFRVAQYYNQATEGYRDWSSNINMHFGFYQWGMNPLDLEAMLENTNRQVLKKLALTGEHNQLLDMGCGLGASVRFCAAHDSVAKVTGISLAASQIDEASVIRQGVAHPEKQQFQQANFHHTDFADKSFDGIYAIESACHSIELDKRSLLKEAYRLLKPGARLAICDGMIKGQSELSGLTLLSYQKTCQHWSVGNFANVDALTAAMSELGFKNIEVRNITWRMMPSAAFIPMISARYWWKLIRQEDKNPQHWHHLFAPLWGLLLGLNIHRFGYFIVTAEK